MPFQPEEFEHIDITFKRGTENILKLMLSENDDALIIT